jgi:hypothetical protein
MPASPFEIGRMLLPQLLRNRFSYMAPAAAAAATRIHQRQQQRDAATGVGNSSSVKNNIIAAASVFETPCDGT